MKFNNSLPYSQASENNKIAILKVFKQHLKDSSTLLEIGGGTGQHAAFFSDIFKTIHWQSTDITSNVDLLNLRILQTNLSNLPRATTLDVNQADWKLKDETDENVKTRKFDSIFTANSLHIMSASSVENFFQGIARHLRTSGLLLVYGPFKYSGSFTSKSNALFDQWLKDKDPMSGIRDFEWINTIAKTNSLQLIEDNAMPANNQMLVWTKFE
jgi:cyclopropane fatty-acyl-phospholipid synthase-like methyltransferase